MQDATEFGKILRGLMVKNNLRQVELAKELEVSPAILSNYLTGKNIPEMGFLRKCVKRFGLEKRELTDLYYSAFSISAEKRYEIVFDTQFIDSARIEMLVKFLTVLELYPTTLNDGNEKKAIEELRFKIDDCYKALGEDVLFQQEMKPEYSQHSFSLPPDMPKESSVTGRNVVVVKKKSKPTIQETNSDSVPSQRALSSTDIEKNIINGQPWVYDESDIETYEEQAGLPYSKDPDDAY